MGVKRGFGLTKDEGSIKDKKGGLTFA